MNVNIRLNSVFSGYLYKRGDNMNNFKYKDLCPLLNCEKEIEVHVDESKPEGEQFVDFYCDYAAEHGCSFKEEDHCPVFEGAVYKQ